MYLTYSEYLNNGGTLSRPAFNSFNHEASIKVDYYTDRRLVNDTEFTQNVKMCVFKIIELLSTFSNYKNMVTDINNPIVSSQSNDGVTTTFGGYLGATSPQDLSTIQVKLDSDIYNTIKQYLYRETNKNGENLLYRGIR